jgi:hypothetical protein
MPVKNSPTGQRLVRQDHADWAETVHATGKQDITPVMVMMMLSTSHRWSLRVEWSHFDIFVGIFSGRRMKFVCGWCRGWYWRHYSSWEQASQRTKDNEEIEPWQSAKLKVRGGQEELRKGEGIVSASLRTSFLCRRVLLLYSTVCTGTFSGSQVRKGQRFWLVEII